MKYSTYTQIKYSTSAPNEIQYLYSKRNTVLILQMKYSTKTPNEIQH